MFLISGKCVHYRLAAFLISIVAFSNFNCKNSSAYNKEAAETGTVVVAKDSSANKKPAILKAAFKENSLLPDSIKVDSSLKYIYLTFDDGPQPGTMTCFNICKDLGVKGTFFMVGMHTFTPGLKSQVDSIRLGYPEVLLTNHSYTHAFRDKYKLFYSQPREVLEDFLKAQKNLNVPYKIARLPGNNAWVRENVIRSTPQTRSTCLLLDSAGYNVIGWDLEWNFKKDSGITRPVQSAETMIRMVNNAFSNNQGYTRNHIVILTHDRMFYQPAYADSLRKFIKVLKKNSSYVFETVDNYPKLNHHKYQFVNSNNP